MANLERIVNVQISLNTTGISKEGFSTLLIVGPHVHSLARVETYTSADAMIDDGFAANDPLYLAAVDAFSQTPSPSVVKIGRQLVDAVSVTVGKVTAAGTYTVTVSTKDSSGNVISKPYEYTNEGGDTLAILDGIAELITADTGAAVTAVVDSTAGVLTLTGISGDSFKVAVSSMLKTGVATVTEDIPTMMAAIVSSDNDWYGWAMVDRTPSAILAAAAWTEAHRKLFGTAIAEAGAMDSDVTTDTGYQLMNNNYFRTHWWYHADAATDFPECAVFARCFAIEPGGENWANKKLAGVVTDNLTETQYLAITKKNGNTFERFRNVSITQNGKVAAGEWIDIIRFRDWLQEEMTVNIFNALINRDKLPYTDDGIAVVENQMRAALRLGQERGGIAPTEYDEDGNENLGFTITVPLASSISPNTKASRKLEDVRFTARLAGAINVIEIKGSLTYENLIVGGAA